MLGLGIGVEIRGAFAEVVRSGSPLERDPALVLESVPERRVGVDDARARYGVATVDGYLAERATAEART